MPSSLLIFCCPLLLLIPIPPSIRVFSNESTHLMRWPKYWSFSFNISPTNEHPGLICFKMDWLNLLAVQGTPKSLLQHQSSKASIFWYSAFFIGQLSHPYMTTGKTIVLTRWTFVGKDSSASLRLQGDPTKSILKEISPGCSLEGRCWSWNSSTLATSREELTQWERPWCWEGLGAGGEGDDRGWDDWMASLIWWTWVWVNSGSWWWTGRPGVLRFMGLQRVEHDWVTELMIKRVTTYISWFCFSSVSHIYS